MKKNIAIVALLGISVVSITFALMQRKEAQRQKGIAEKARIQIDSLRALSQSQQERAQKMWEEALSNEKKDKK